MSDITTLSGQQQLNNLQLLQQQNQQRNQQQAEPLSQATLPREGAVFFSPRIAIDVETSQAIVQIRDTETGDVLRSFPPESATQALAAQQTQADQIAQQFQNQIVPENLNAGEEVANDLANQAGDELVETATAEPIVQEPVAQGPVEATVTPEAAPATNDLSPAALAPQTAQAQGGAAAQSPEQQDSFSVTLAS